jgi:hypothetical protein
MSSEASSEVVAAESAIYNREPAAAIAHALIAIRAELRTANLIAAAAIHNLPIFSDGWGATAGAQYPEAAAVRAEIREELDLEGSE